MNDITRPAKDKAVTEVAVGPLPSEINARLEELKKAFPDMCLDGIHFLPNLKSIPARVIQSTLEHTNDLVSQYREWYRIAHQVSRVAKDRGTEIEKLKHTISLKDLCASSVAEQLKLSQTERQEALEKAEKAEKALIEHVKKHLDDVEILHSRNHEIRERGNALVASEAAAKKEAEDAKKVIAELNAKLEAADKARDDAEKVVQKASEDVVKAQNSVVLKIAEALKQKEQESEQDLDGILVQYSADVLRCRDLTFLGELYPYHLFEAWNQILEFERSGGEDFDEFELERKYLNDEERGVLHAAQLDMMKEPQVTSQYEIGEGSGSGQPDVLSDVPPRPTRSKRSRH